MDILFWSGGKDAWLTLEFYRLEQPDADIKLLTTFEKESEIVPHQNIPIANVKKQAEALNLKLSLIPLPQDCPNDIYLDKITKALDKENEPIEHLLFGDWYLQDIRDWREQQFKKIGYTCRFPIWKKPLDELLPIVLLKPVEVRISAVSKDYEQFIRMGEVYNQHFIRQLPKEIDPMGEKGEFHTEVVFKEWDNKKPANRPLC